MRRYLPLTVLAAALSFAVSTAATAETALERLVVRGILAVCADPYIYPYSSASAHPPGFDIEIIQAIAERNGLGLEYIWVDTGTRGGLGRALRNSIVRGQCAVFTGIAIDDDQVAELAEKNLTFSVPYMGAGYILVVNDQVGDVGGIDDLQGTRIGVSMTTPIDAWLFDHGYDRELYRGNRRVMKGMAEGEVDAALIWMTALATAIQEFPDQNFRRVESYLPQPGMRWNLAFAIPRGADDLARMINGGIAEMIADGTIAEIVEGYGLPYYEPFTD